MTYRLIKQIIYGAGFLTIIFLIGFGVYFAFLRPAGSCFDNRKNQGETDIDCGGPCVPCAVKNLLPPETQWIKYFPIDGQTIIAAEIQNPNVDYGASAGTLTLTLYGKDAGPTKIINREFFIYGAEIKYIMEPVDIDYQNIQDAKIEFSNLSWKSKREFPTPKIQTRNIRTETGENNVPKITGFILNQNAFRLSKAKIIGLLQNKDGWYIAASQTEIENLEPFGEKSFQISFPRNIKFAQPESDGFIFTKDLKIGSTGKDVAELQKFLKNQGLFAGDVSDYFGNTTQSAVMQYQKKRGINPVSGFFGPKTRAIINEEIKKSEATPLLNQNIADPEKTRVYVEAARE